MIEKPLNKLTDDGRHYRLVFFDDNNQVVWKDNNVNCDEAEHSTKVAEFNDRQKAIEYWNKIK